VRTTDTRKEAGMPVAQDQRLRTLRKVVYDDFVT
jgi:hypothetical protein